MVATFFFQRTTAFTLFSIVPSLQISCLRKTKEKQYAKLNKRMAARLIWQLVIHRCVIFAYIIRRRDGENNSFLAGVSLLPFLLARPSRFPRAQNALSLPLQTPATQATGKGSLQSSLTAVNGCELTMPSIRINSMFNSEKVKVPFQALYAVILWLLWKIVPTIRLAMVNARWWIST